MNISGAMRDKRGGYGEHCTRRNFSLCTDRKVLRGHSSEVTTGLTFVSNGEASKSAVISVRNHLAKRQMGRHGKG
jgi:hypothetical protein